MTSALVHLNGPPGAHPLASDLEAAGIQVLGCVGECSKLVQEALRHAPDVVICYDPLPDEELFRALQVIGETSSRPVIVFTSDGDAEKITRAVAAGVHAYVINGYGPQRLRSLIHLAQARFSREQALRAEMFEVSRRLEERKVVDRAKGILMRARQVSDDDAFQMLRTASMHTNQRLGQVSQHIIHSARFAEDVNRSGQLRMLSQRLVKLALQQLAGVQVAQAKQHLKESVLRIDANIVALGKSLSQPTFGDLLEQVGRTWAQLKQALQDEPQARHMGPLDELAEQLLHEAERLTSSLENAGAMPPLQVLNLAGRQRMLSQRFAKYALLEAMGGKAATPRYTEGMAESRAAFEQALKYLNEIPLTSGDIRTSLDAAAACWEHMLAGAAPVGQGAPELLERLERLAVASEELLGIFERLSVHYERSMQMLVG
ncbi:type IV pili methyl-accepting chemotaxis transducer N-terminal domain-containing protein [Polaromonas sp. JS666]|uniref:type IV pili methyl-accepting chemotaxis transducer N-terminal domain-containing protein n=1 Tax=Polaromonas sp. (strain JS666 / ATCC BAA-500) TaxID=296591 RepID=UPI00005346C7|nr:type IV pili methyl-accepting chemotaxis transducer N-terminal domain-containing protein [Polaromonas sp. JS666]ABE45189.1 response regulator receiver (CheY-like) and ANTAR domain protein [Polaromonas sp. JS666]